MAAEQLKPFETKRAKMRLLQAVASLILFAASIAGAATSGAPYAWRGIQVQKATVETVKKALGEPTAEYREQLLYENQVFDPADPNGQNVRLNTVVFNIGANGVVDSIFISPEWGTTDQDLRPFLGKGKKTLYRKFLATMGEVKVGAGTRPNEKLHYVDLESPCEVFAQSRVLMLYHRQDVVSGNYLLQFILFY